jgi:DNA-directed RNA polymerase subunit RPC12/RpoP
MAKVSKISFKTVYKCRECGATSYQPMVGRAHNGALLPNGKYRCSGCRNVFDDLKSWWTPLSASSDAQPIRNVA